jgi:hypothetical protein
LESVSRSLVHKSWARLKWILNAYYRGAVYGEHAYRSRRKASSSAESFSGGPTTSGNLKRRVIRSGMTGEDEGGSGTVREASVSIVCLHAVCFRVWFSVFLAQFQHSFIEENLRG